MILAVDDDAEDSEFFCDAIQEIDSSIVVMKARNGEDALHLLENHLLLPDFIFLDINMPMMDGKTCLQEIKKIEKLKDVPVIMYSTSSNKAEILQFKSMGAGFLVKPNHFSKLVRSLSFILGYTKEPSEYFFLIL